MDMTKYEKVLRPLKQLEEVWGIDLAAALQSYAAEVAEVKVVMGGQALNFAQAALLIMGASSIYSKKVDALQGLVQDTYELIINKKNADDKENPKKKRKRMVLRQTVTFTDESTVINRASRLYRDDVTETLRLILAGSDGPGARGICRDVARISEGELVPFEDTQSGGFNFRVNICSITPDGLLLPNVKQELTRITNDKDPEHVTPKRHRVQMPPTPASTVTSKDILTESAQKKSQMDDEKGYERALAEAIKKEIEEDEKQAREEGESDDENDKEGSNDGEQGPQEPDEYDNLMMACNQDRFEVTLKETPFDQLEIREKTASGDPVKQLVTEVLKEKMESNINDKLRKVDAQGNILWDTDLLEKTPAIGVKCKDLEDQYAAAKDKLKQCLVQERNRKKAAEAEKEAEGTADVDGAPNVGNVQETEDVERHLGMAPDDLNQLHDVNLNMEEPHEAGGYESFDDSDAPTPDPHRRIQMDSGEVAAAADTIGEQFDFNTDIARMNELMNAVHMESNEKIAHTSKEEANLHVKIAAWQNKLEPVLEDMDSRPAFDIHEYAGRILDQFTPEQNSFSFGKLASIAKEQWELPRFFLALLQLTNTQNVGLDITHKQSGALSDEIKVTLLTRDNAFNFDEIDDTSAGVMVSQRERRGLKRKH